MTVLGIIGAMFVTVAVLLPTLWLLGSLFVQWQVAGLNCMTWREWAWIVFFASVIAFGWFGWYQLVGGITISIGITS